MRKGNCVLGVQDDMEASLGAFGMLSKSDHSMSRFVQSGEMWRVNRWTSRRIVLVESMAQTRDGVFGWVRRVIPIERSFRLRPSVEFK
jgi:hypothetical protein